MLSGKRKPRVAAAPQGAGARPRGPGGETQACPVIDSAGAAGPRDRSSAHRRRRKKQARRWPLRRRSAARRGSLFLFKFRRLITSVHGERRPARGRLLSARLAVSGRPPPTLPSFSGLCLRCAQPARQALFCAATAEFRSDAGLHRGRPLLHLHCELDSGPLRGFRLVGALLLLGRVLVGCREDLFMRLGLF